MDDFTRVESTAKRIKEAMKNAGKKQIDIVRETGIDKGALNHYLKGNYEPKQEAIHKLASALNVSEMWLYGYDCNMERKTNKTFGENLLHYIEKSGKTQREIADAVGVAPSTFNDWCKGRKYPRMNKVDALASYFGIKKSDLIEERIGSEYREMNGIVEKVKNRMISDNDFCSVIESIYYLNQEQLESINKLLNDFSK